MKYESMFLSANGNDNLTNLGQAFPEGSAPKPGATGGDSPFGGLDQVVAIAETLNLNDVQNIALKEVKEELAKVKAHFEDTGNALIFGDEDKLGYFLRGEGFEYGGE